MIEISQNKINNGEKKTGRPEIPIEKQLLSVDTCHSRFI